MAEGYNALEGSQTDINRRILRRLDALEEASEPYDDTAIKARIKAVEDEIGDEDTADTILKRIKDLEDAA
jgi:hypothetical protein